MIVGNLFFEDVIVGVSEGAGLAERVVVLVVEEVEVEIWLFSTAV